MICRDISFRQASEPSSHDRNASDDLLVAQTEHKFPESSLYARVVLNSGPDAE